MSTDIRVNVTKNIIKESLMQLLPYRDIKDITVNDLCNKAQISRTTFYRYYQCADDVLTEIERSCVSKLSEMVRNEKGAEADKILFKLLESIKLSPTYLKIGFSDSDRFNSLIEEELYPYVKQIMSERWKDKSEEQKHIIFDFISHGINGVIKTWIESGFYTDPRIIVEEIKSIQF